MSTTAKIFSRRNNSNSKNSSYNANANVLE